MRSVRSPRIGPKTGARRQWALLVLVGTLALLVAACAQDPSQSALEPAGDRAREIDALWQIVLYIAIGVFVLVEGAIVFAAIRFRRRRADETPVQVHGNSRLEIAWTVIPALLLAGLAFPTVSTIFSLSRRPAGEVLEVNVTGHQWWWEFEYPEQGFVTANEMHIPVGTPVHLTLTSAETPGGIAEFTEEGQPVSENAIPVIHSFWAPRLAGKQDMVPGRTHTLNLEADEPGVYSGQCTEFCGLSHAFMRLRVVAQTEEDFQRWVEGQQAAAAEPEQGSLAAEGAEIFQQFQGATVSGSCLACHAVDPSQGGTVGPNLAHLASRDTFAAALLELTPENLARWLDDPREVKPGVVMPDYRLSEDQIEALVAYLMTLE